MTPREHKNLIRKKKMIARNLLSPAYRHMKSISLADLGAKKIPLEKKKPKSQLFILCNRKSM
ncbi:hypothetical protein CLIBASIA_02720 [Candidatus Liberibacter asiaticus str. psy62]|uniref:Uncharacterized protein n=1 Tax=Liberibacter asiaticus (strain psy62) TaxID=537021 RepID=C6XFH7_LIBAP|nr:hypothetical protein CLIBASIA_02720 [Candidatus Liberibacter asiaticus str. psy62]